MNKNVLTAIISGITCPIIIEIFQILIFKEPIKKHKEIYSKIKYLERNYIDVFNKNMHDNYYIGILDKQLKLIKQIEDELYKINDIYPVFAFLFNYKKIIYKLRFLLYYTKDPIMLAKDRLFSKDYKIDLKSHFKKIYFYMNFQYRILVILIVLLLLIIYFILVLL